MSTSMKWSNWYGLVGDGTYVILNKASLTCLDLHKGSKEPGTKVQGFAHSPDNWAQQWIIRKYRSAEVYVILNVQGGTPLTAKGVDQPVVGAEESKSGQLNYPVEALWVIDKGTYGLEPGKMVVFGSVKHPGYVLDLHHGKKENGTPVRLIQDRGLSDSREMQKWLLQVQPK